mgnify:CR=1 FL=1
MNYSELLHDFLDGTLAGEHQESLFHALAQDIDLRAEMQQLLRIKRAVQSDTEAFMPPPEARDAIFARLGFGASAPIPTPPVQVPSVQIPNAPIAETVIAAAAPIVQRVLWREVLLSSLATSLFTGLLFFFFLRPYGNSTFGGSMSTGFNSNGTIPPQSGYASAANFNASSVQTRDTVRVMREVVHHYHTGSQTSAATNDFQNGLQREFAQFQATMSALTDELRSALHDAREENKRLTAERNAETKPTTTTAPTETAMTPPLPQAPQWRHDSTRHPTPARSPARDPRRRSGRPCPPRGWSRAPAALLRRPPGPAGARAPTRRPCRPRAPPRGRGRTRYRARACPPPDRRHKDSAPVVGDGHQAASRRGPRRGLYQRRYQTSSQRRRTRGNLRSSTCR